VKGEPPLEIMQTVDVDPDTGGEIFTERYERGVSATETKTYDARALLALSKAWPNQSAGSARQDLKDFAEHLRANLTKAGYPTDLHPLWIKIDDGEWQPRNVNEPLPQGRISQSHWDSLLEKLTPPLSKPYAAGRLLASIVEILEVKEFEDKHLRMFGRAMNLFGEYRVAGHLNYLAYQGLKARKARTQGPISVQRRAQSVREIVKRHTEHYWKRHALHRNDALNTAASIAETVNEDLRTQGLLPKNRTGLSTKTISEHIRKSIGG
jgi:hypothetical protein